MQCSFHSFHDPFITLRKNLLWKQIKSSWTENTCPSIGPPTRIRRGLESTYLSREYIARRFDFIVLTCACPIAVHESLNLHSPSKGSS
jgi:hypothetical protein